jgi:hypothetical protein
MFNRGSSQGKFDETVAGDLEMAFGLAAMFDDQPFARPLDQDASQVPSRMVPAHKIPIFFTMNDKPLTLKYRLDQVD